MQLTKTQGNFHFAPGHRLHRRVNTMNMMDQLQVCCSGDVSNKTAFRDDTWEPRSRSQVLSCHVFPSRLQESARACSL